LAPLEENLFGRTSTRHFFVSDDGNSHPLIRADLFGPLLARFYGNDQHKRVKDAA